MIFGITGNKKNFSAVLLPEQSFGGSFRDDPDFAFLGKSIRLKLRAGAAYSTARTSSVPE